MNTQSIFTSPEGKQAILGYYDMLLNKMTVPYQRLSISTRFGDTFVLACGDESAPPLILLHGSSMNAAMWIRDMERYSQTHRVYAADLPGEPGRSAEAPLPFDTADYADWLCDVMDGLNIQRAALCGISLGAWLSILFAVKYPQRVDRLILLCPAGVGPQNHAFKDVALSLLSQGEAGVDALFMKINGDAPIPEIMLTYQKLIAAHFNSRKEVIPLFTDAELASLTMPCTLFFGEKDIMLLAAEATERFARLVPGAAVFLLPEKGHSLTGLADTIVASL